MGYGRAVAGGLAAGQWGTGAAMGWEGDETAGRRGRGSYLRLIEGLTAKRLRTPVARVAFDEIGRVWGFVERIVAGRRQGWR